MKSSYSEKNDPDYKSSEHLLDFAFYGSMVLGIVMFCLSFPYEPALINRLSNWCVLLVSCINLLIGMRLFFRREPVSQKIFFFLFATVETLIVSFAVFFVVYLVIYLIVAIFFIKLMLMFFFHAPMGASGGSSASTVAGASGGASGASGDGSIHLSNGDTVKYDAMTGDYRSTDPIADNYYKKDGNDFVQR